MLNALTVTSKQCMSVETEVARRRAGG